MKHVKLFEDFKNHEETFPSEEFAKVTGMNWLTKDWKMPGNPDEIGYNIEKWSDQLENKKTADKASDNLISLYKKILKLNPELKDLGEPKSWDNILDFCRGTLSKFNLDDIKFYSNLGWDDRMKYNVGNRDLSNKINQTAQKIALAKIKKGSDDLEKFNPHSFQVQWVMSPKTIERVKKELKMK